MQKPPQILFYDNKNKGTSSRSKPSIRQTTKGTSIRSRTSIRQTKTVKSSRSRTNIRQTKKSDRAEADMRHRGILQHSEQQSAYLSNREKAKIAERRKTHRKTQHSNEQTSENTNRNTKKSLRRT